jgi:hypothetical protein
LNSITYIPIYSPIISKILKISKIVEIPHHMRSRPCPCGIVPAVGLGKRCTYPF